MKRVLLITENLGSGGAERQLCGLAILLKQRGYIVKVVTYAERQFYEPLLRENNVDYELRKELLNKYTRAFRLVAVYKQFKPDTIISFLPSTNLGVCLSRLFYKCHVIVSERSHTMNWGLKTKLIYAIYSLADKIVANSNSEKLNIAEHCQALRKKVFAISNFVDTEKFVPAVKIQHDKVQILCVARLLAVKNVAAIIDVAHHLKEQNLKFKIKWVGAKFDKDYAQQMELKIKDLGLQDCFVLCDQTSNIVKEYQQADVFCLPSFFEGFPNVVCEAMSCGLPILCSNVCENPFIIEDKGNGFLFDPHNVSDIEDKFKLIIKLKSEDLKRMGQMSRELALIKFSMDKFVDNYIEIL